MLLPTMPWIAVGIYMVNVTFNFCTVCTLGMFDTKVCETVMFDSCITLPRDIFCFILYQTFKYP